MMRPRTAILSVTAFLACLYPFVLWQIEWFFSSLSVQDRATSWFWIAQPLLLTVFFYAASAGMRQKILCYACIITATCFFAFAAAEAYFRLPSINPTISYAFKSHESVYVKSGQTAQLYEQRGYFSTDPVLGYCMNPNGKIRVASRPLSDNKVLYDVLYSGDEGRRITPDRGDKADTAILIFGCSFTFGEGINDRETFAWQLGEMLGKQFQVFNYGFHGYGSHQMLALIESGRLDALMQRYTQVYAAYLTIHGHEWRSAGLASWDQDGPRYILENGTLRHAGKFSARPRLAKCFLNSQVYTRVKKTYYSHAAPSALDTHAAIIAKSMHELYARYHAHALTVIWPDSTRIEQKLRERGVRVLPLAGAMPDYQSTPDKYTITGDGHPNPLANTRVAEALAAYMLQHPQATEKQR